MHKSATKEGEGQSLIRMRDTYNGACGAATQQNKEEIKKKEETDAESNPGRWTRS